MARQLSHRPVLSDWGSRNMRYVIVARAPSKAGNLQYFAGDGSNLLQAARFRTERDAERRVRHSLICRRMIESGARLEVRRLSSPA